VAKEIIWSKQAEQRFDAVIDFLKVNWTDKEIIQFVTETQRVVETIKKNPEAFRKSEKTNYREALITKHNLLIYSVSKTHIKLITFWDTRQHPRKKAK
jgi:plasmid stabilization system protein ParE